MQLKRSQSLLSKPTDLLKFGDLKKKLVENTFDGFKIDILPNDIDENKIKKIVVRIFYKRKYFILILKFN